MEEMKKSGFGQSLTLCLVTWKENVVKEKDQHVFIYFTTRKIFFFFFLFCKRYIQEYDEVELSALGMGTFSSNFLCITFSSVLYPNMKKIRFFFFFLFSFPFVE